VQGQRPTPIIEQTIKQGPRVVIIGARFGGLAAARALSGEQVEVLVVDRRTYHLFQPLL
jgi:NADH dehydrogenase